MNIVKITCCTILFGVVVVAIAILSFLLLYKLKTALGIDIFPDMHLKDILENIFNGSQGGT